FGDLARAREQVFDARSLRIAKPAPHARVFGNHVRNIAAFLNRVVHAHRRFYELAHPIESGCEEFKSRDRASAVPGIGGGVRGLSFELDDEIYDRLRAIDVGYGLVFRMPRETYIEIVKQTFARHVDLSADGLFSGSAVKANRSFELPGGDHLFDRERGAETRRAEQVMPAAVPRGTGFQSLFHRLRLLRDAGQSVIFAEDSNNRPALPVAGGERGRHPSDSAFYIEALLLGIIREQLR